MGLLAWPSKPVIRRHVFTARVELQFEAATGVIRVTGATDGAQLRIEDDMLETRPDRSHYESVTGQLNEIDDNVWDRALVFTALKSWGSALHAHSEWSPELRPILGQVDEPAISFAPALILRKRTQAGMVRIYDAIIRQLSQNVETIPAGWTGLVEDGDDRENAGEVIDGERVSQPDVDAQQTYFPLPSNNEQRRIAEAINSRRGVLVQGPPGTGKSHTIANLMCHLLATGKKVLITAETGRALKVLKNKLPEEIQPLCISLLGQGGDSFAELNAAVQGITSRYAAWRPGAYDQQIGEIDRELDTRRRGLAKLDAELRSLRAEETFNHKLANGAYEGSASSVAKRVADERGQFGWLQILKDAPDDPPLTQEALAVWLHVRRSYDQGAIEQSRLQIVPCEKLAAPVDFGVAVTAERDAIDATNRLEALRKHVAYESIVALRAEERAKLAEAIRGLEDRRKKLLRLSYEWLSAALKEALGGRLARLKALSTQSRELVARIDQLQSNLGTTTFTLPADKDIAAIRSDAAALIQHLKSGGGWTKWFFIEPKAVKGRTYFREQVIVAGKPADTHDSLQLVCDHLDMVLAFNELDGVWRDHGGLPRESSARIRLAAVKEHVAILEDALEYSRLCSEVGRYMNGATPSIPEPDWLAGQAGILLEIIDASIVEQQRLLAARNVTASLRDLALVRNLHDAHPVVTELHDAVERRDIAAYSRAYHETQKIEQLRQNQKVREVSERMLRGSAPGFVEAVEASLGDKTWDKRFADWQRAWHWATADNWLRKRTDFMYQRELLARRQATEQTISQLVPLHRDYDSLTGSG